MGQIRPSLDPGKAKLMDWASAAMIDFYFSATPNGLKVRLFLEEAGVEYRIIPVRLAAGEQYKPEFVAISPNGKIPAIVDHAPRHGGSPQPVFESGAIMLYLAEKSGRFLPADPRARLDALQWLFWQVAGLGPMAGQAGYFRVLAALRVDAAVERYTRELTRLYGVLDRRLAGRSFMAGDEFSLADIAVYPWIVPHRPHGQDLHAFGHLERWFQRIAARPATKRVYDGVEDVYAQAQSQGLSAAARNALFQQGGATPSN
jgi:GST-like protein